MKVKYYDRETFSPIDSYTSINPSRVRLTGKNLFSNTSGFDIYNNNNEKLYVCSDYNVIYDSNVDEEYIEYTNDTAIYYVFDVYNDDMLVTGQVISTESEYPNSVLRTSGQGKTYVEAEPIYEYLDEDGYYNYKVVINNIGTDDEPETIKIIVPVTEEEKEAWKKADAEKAFENALAYKLNEISNACKTAITNGIDLNNSHYTYDADDQNNISNAVTLANQTKLAVPYHADGESCRLFEPEEITTIYVLEETNLTHNVTYHNQLKLYVQTLETIEEIETIKYGETELTGQYLDVYNMIMIQAQEVIRHFIGENNMPAAADEESPVEVPEDSAEIEEE